MTNPSPSLSSLNVIYRIKRLLIPTKLIEQEVKVIERKHNWEHLMKASELLTFFTLERRRPASIIIT